MPRRLRLAAAFSASAAPSIQSAVSKRRCAMRPSAKTSPAAVSASRMPVAETYQTVSRARKVRAKPLQDSAPRRRAEALRGAAKESCLNLGVDGVADAAHGLDELRLEVAVNLVAQVLDEHVHGVR